MAPQTLLTPETKEVVVDMDSVGVWVNRTPRKVSRAGVDRSTPGDIFNAFSIENALFPVLI